MNKITKKLFRYFSSLLLFLAVTAFTGFFLVFLYFTYQHHEQELKTRTETIKNQLEQFISNTGPKQGRGAYLRFLDDIALADVYIINADGAPFSYGKHTASKNIPTEEIQTFAADIFSSHSYKHLRKRDENGQKVFLTGMPVMINNQVTAAVIIYDTTDIDTNSFIFAITILGCCLLTALFLSGIFSVILSRRFVLPIQQIAHTAKELAGGNYLAVTNVRDKTELGELAGEIDQLAQKLESARQESIRFEQMQKDYISNISHELRTPVTVIRSSLEAVCDGVVTGEKALEYQKQMLAESISLQRLINDMLELSRLQNKDFPIETEQMDLLMALDDAIRAVRVIARDKNIQIIYEKKSGEFLIDGDYGRLRQMFITALDNAIKYSPPKSQIIVYAKCHPSQCIISIQDFGCGILQEDMEHIFDRFYRSSHNTQKGSGLGLAIMKSISERHGIAIKLQSVYQKGTEVSFCIPNIPPSRP